MADLTVGGVGNVGLTILVLPDNIRRAGFYAGAAAYTSANTLNRHSILCVRAERPFVMWQVWG